MVIGLKILTGINDKTFFENGITDIEINEAELTETGFKTNKKKKIKDIKFVSFDEVSTILTIYFVKEKTFFDLPKSLFSNNKIEIGKNSVELIFGN